LEVDIEIFYVRENVKKFETLTDEKLKNDVVRLLKKFLAQKLSKPSQMIRTKWQTNKNFLGSYSSNFMNAEKNHASPSILKKNSLMLQEIQKFYTLEKRLISNSQVMDMKLSSLVRMLQNISLKKLKLNK
jgi:hypothetical protein